MMNTFVCISHATHIPPPCLCANEDDAFQTSTCAYMCSCTHLHTSTSVRAPLDTLPSLKKRGFAPFEGGRIRALCFFFFACCYGDEKRTTRTLLLLHVCSLSPSFIPCAWSHAVVSARQRALHSRTLAVPDVDAHFLYLTSRKIAENDGMDQ